MNLAILLFGILIGLTAPVYLLLFSRISKSTSVKLIRALSAWHSKAVAPPPEAQAPQVSQTVQAVPASSVGDVVASLRKMGASSAQSTKLAQLACDSLPATATSDEILIAAIRLSALRAPGIVN